MSGDCFEGCGEPAAFRCLRCREDVCEACVTCHVCADKRPDEEDEE